MVDSLAQLCEDQLFRIRQESPGVLFAQTGEEAARRSGADAVVHRAEQHALGSAAGVAERPISVMPQVGARVEIVKRADRVPNLKGGEAMPQQHRVDAQAQMRMGTLAVKVFGALRPFALAQGIYHQRRDSGLGCQISDVFILRGVLAGAGVPAQLDRRRERRGVPARVRQIEIGGDVGAGQALEDDPLDDASTARNAPDDLGVERSPLLWEPSQQVEHLRPKRAATCIELILRPYGAPGVICCGVEIEHNVVGGAPGRLRVVLFKDRLRQKFTDISNLRREAIASAVNVRGDGKCQGYGNGHFHLHFLAILFVYCPRITFPGGAEKVYHISRKPQAHAGRIRIPRNVV